MRYWLVMPGAGRGRRFGEALPKQYAELCGRTVIEWALTPFLTDSRCAGAVVVIASDDAHWSKLAERVPRIGCAIGGTHRCESVRSGLAALEGRATQADWVLVHDAARPCLAAQDLERLLERLQEHPVGGLLAVPAADTLKRTRGGHTVLETVDRSELWRALTPQMFRYGRLCKALDAAAAVGRVPTDEAQAIEWLGDAPLTVEGSSANIKVTTADDLLIAAALLGARSIDCASGGQSR
ncbi:MAG TPA: 2-C-methyl-D-erythritol 4-phosphate cytidylyltransferase [Steroidobacteraceae bacterium]|nr:2-C-methyl-D-erythritol 4-phosphate cytidylyltransferase [Steroidobacteraceae bacterium]